MKIFLLSILSVSVTFLTPLIAEENLLLVTLLKRYPEADTNKDGELTVVEAQDFMATPRAGGRMQKSEIFVPSNDEIEAAIQGGKALQYPSANDGSLRIAMTGHSWVAPGIRTLPPIAKAAGYEGHEQVTHTGGGGTGAVNAIWLKEFGKWKDGSEAKPTLIPALSTGEWDVLTWGPFFGDRPEYFAQWINFCHQRNPETRFYFQDAWPRFPSAHRNSNNSVAAKAIAEEHAMLQEFYFAPLYERIEKSFPGQVTFIPVSAALADLIEQFAAGKIEHLTCINEGRRKGEVGFYSDGGHLSRSSGIEHLVGYAYFSMLYRRSPVTVENYTPEGVPAAFDQQMRKAIWKAVVESPFADIDDEDGDGRADE